jgi:hypothetical protein
VDCHINAPPTINDADDDLAAVQQAKHVLSTHPEPNTESLKMDRRLVHQGSRRFHLVKKLGPKLAYSRVVRSRAKLVLADAVRGPQKLTARTIDAVPIKQTLRRFRLDLFLPN